MSVEKGTFQTVKPPNIYGNNRYLAKDTSKMISGNVNIGKNKTIFLPGLMNNYTSCIDSECLQITPANINYRLIENTLGMQFQKTTKDNNYYSGWGVGVQNQPYVFLCLAIMEKFLKLAGRHFGV